jgi:hypothetical protein
MVTRRRRGHPPGFLKQHSLTIALTAIVVFWIEMYRHSDPATHLGSFFGNSIADWLGTLMFIISSKYFFEIGSKESKPLHARRHHPVVRFLLRHSLSLVIIVTGFAWVALFARSDPGGKAGQVYGNIVSEWWQLLALVLMTKYLKESGSKEGEA